MGWKGARKKAQDTKKQKVRGENTGHSQTQQCVGERLDRETKRASEKKKKSERQEHSSLTAIVGERLGWTGARKKQGTRILAEEDYTTACKFLVQKALKEV